MNINQNSALLNLIFACHEKMWWVSIVLGWAWIQPVTLSLPSGTEVCGKESQIVRQALGTDMDDVIK